MQQRTEKSATIQFMKVLVIVARGLQLSAVSCYGNPWIESPALDALAAEGVVFDQHFAGAVDPAASRRALSDLLAALNQPNVATHLIVDASRPYSPVGAGWDRVEIVEQQEDELPLETMLYAVRGTLDQLKQRDDGFLWIELATLLQPWEPPEEY